MTTEQQDKRRKAAAASKAIQALAQAVQAGRAGQPPSTKALAVLATVLQALQDGTDPEKVFFPPRLRGRPPRSAPRDRNFWRVVTVLELEQAGLDYEEARARVLVGNPRTGAGPLDAGPEDSTLRKHVQRWRKQAEQWLADDALEPTPPPMPDRPDASEEFKSG